MRTHLLVPLLLLVFATCADASRNIVRALNLSPISAVEIEHVRTQPLSLLSKFLDGGPPMAQYVSRLVQADPSLVDSILSVSDQATIVQAPAIGAGLARAARVIKEKQPKQVNDIIKKTMLSQNKSLKITFKAIGPKFNQNLALEMPDLIQRPPLEERDVGEFLPIERSRLGETGIDGPDVIRNSDETKEEAQGLIIETREGIIAAVQNDGSVTSIQNVVVLPPKQPPTPPKSPPPTPPKNPVITKVISSDAGSGGTVSTSPTI